MNNVTKPKAKTTPQQAVAKIPVEARPAKVLSSLKGQNCDLLFTLAVVHFDLAPNKKKALAIYEVFVDEHGPWDGFVGEFDRTSSAGVAILLNLKMRADWMIELRAKAKGMNIFKRIKSSGDRAVAVCGMFGPFLDGANLLGGGALMELLNDSRATDRVGQGDWETRAQTAKQVLVGGGFNASLLGLTSIADAPPRPRR